MYQEAAQALPPWPRSRIASWRDVGKARIVIRRCAARFARVFEAPVRLFTFHRGARSWIGRGIQVGLGAGLDIFSVGAAYSSAHSTSGASTIEIQHTTRLL